MRFWLLVAVGLGIPTCITLLVVVPMSGLNRLSLILAIASMAINGLILWGI